MDKKPAVYILSSRRNGTLYIGVTSNLVKRVWEHKNDLAAGFTKRYRIHSLVHFELFETMMLNKVIPIYDDRETALRHIREEDRDCKAQRETLPEE